MPRIPDYEAAGVSVPRSTTPRFTDRSAQIEAEGQQALLGAVGQVVQQAVEHDDKLRYAAARSTVLQAQMAARKELEGDNDYETYETRYTERMAKAQAEAASNIRGRRSRELFEADAQADIARGVEQVRGLARGREVDEGVTLMNGNLESNRNAALESKDPNERAALLESSYDLIDGAFERGIIKEDQAREVKSKYRANYAEAFVSIQTPAERIAMLSKPDTTFAQYIPPDRRAVLLEAAKRDDDEVRVRGESQAYFDQVMAKYGTDFKGALRDAREELKADPKLRDATEDRIREEQVAAATFERADTEAAGAEAMQFLISGGPGGKPGKYADLDLGLKARIKPATQIALKNFSQSGGRTVSDPETLVKLSQLASDPQNFADKVNMLDYRALLTDADFQQGLDLQQKIRTGTVDGKASGFQSINEARDKKLVEFFGGTTAKNKKGQAEINDFVTKFEAEQRAFKEQNGKAPSTDEARKLMDQMWAEIVTKEGFISDTKKRAYQLTEEDVQVPTAYVEAIVANLHARGKPVTRAEIQRIYRSMRFDKPKQ